MPLILRVLFGVLFLVAVAQRVLPILGRLAALEFRGPELEGFDLRRLEALRTQA